MANPFDDQLVLAKRRELLAEQEAKAKLEAEKATLEAAKWEQEKRRRLEQLKATYVQYIQNSLVKNEIPCITLFNDKRYVLGYRSAINCYGYFTDSLPVADFKSIEADLLAAGYELVQCCKSHYFNDDGGYGDPGTTIDVKNILIRKR